MQATTINRAVLGFLAAALSVLTFHQLMLGALHVLAIPGLEIPNAPYQLTPFGPLHIPRLLNLCFWGGLYGLVFGIVQPKLARRPMWLVGLGFGLLAVLVGFSIVFPIKGQPFGAGWKVDVWARSILINGSFGVGLGLIYPALAARLFGPATRDA